MPVSKIPFGILDGRYINAAGDTMLGDLTIAAGKTLTARTGRSATFIIAANDGDSLGKSQADSVCDGSADESEINSAISSISNGTILLLDGTYQIESNLTIPTGITLSFANSAKLNISGGVSVTFTGQLQAGLHQIFSGAGGVILSDGSITEAYPQWWGAKGDEVTDDASAIQKCFDATKRIHIPASTYLIGTGLTTGANRVVMGDGRNNTILLANSNDLDILTADQSFIANIGILGTGSTGAGCGILLDAFGQATFHKVKILKCAIGIKIRHAWNINFDACEIGYTGANSNVVNDVDIDGSAGEDNPANIRFLSCRFLSDNLSSYHMSVKSCPTVILEGCHFAGGPANTAVYLSIAQRFVAIGVIFEGVNYAIEATNSVAFLTQIGLTGGTNGLIDPNTVDNVNIIDIESGTIEFIGGPSFSLMFSAKTGYGTAFTVVRDWHNCGEEQVLSVDNSGSPNYEQNYEWGGDRSGEHIWRAGKTLAMTLDRTANLSVVGDLSAPGGFKQPFSYMQSDVAASQTGVALAVLGLAGNNEVVMPYSGSVIGISVASNEARTAGTLTVDATVNGTETGLQAQLDGTNVQYHSTTQAKDTDTFSAGNRLGVKITTDSSWAPNTADIVVAVIVEM